jgi:hypothetical protein
MGGNSSKTVCPPNKTVYTPGPTQTVYTPGATQTVYTPGATQTVYTPGATQTVYTPVSNYIGLTYNAVDGTTGENLAAIQNVVNQMQNIFCSQHSQYLLNVIATLAASQVSEETTTTNDAINQMSSIIQELFDNAENNMINTLTINERSEIKNSLMKLFKTVLTNSSVNDGTGKLILDNNTFFNNLNKVVYSICPNSQSLTGTVLPMDTIFGRQLNKRPNLPQPTQTPNVTYSNVVRNSDPFNNNANNMSTRDINNIANVQNLFQPVPANLATKPATAIRIEPATATLATKPATATKVQPATTTATKVQPATTTATLVRSFPSTTGKIQDILNYTTLPISRINTVCANRYNANKNAVMANGELCVVTTAGAGYKVGNRFTYDSAGKRFIIT